MQLSSLIGKPVLSRAGERLGYVTALQFARDYSRIACLICADTEEEEFILPARAVLSVADAVIAGRQRLSEATGEPSPVGRMVYLHTGEEMGAVSDVETGEIPALCVRGKQGEEKIPIVRAAIGETVIVYPSERERRTAGTAARKREAHRQERMPRSSLVSEKNDRATPTTNHEQTSIAAEAGEGKAVRIDRTNLLGRIVRRSVFDDRGHPIARAGDRVTPDMIGHARRENRLLALTVNTLTNLES